MRWSPTPGSGSSSLARGSRPSARTTRWKRASRACGRPLPSESTALPVTKAEGLQQLHKPTLLVSVFGLGTLAWTVVTQMAIAALFGAGAELDALLAANVLPQYLVAVVSSALGFVLVPVFVGYAAGAREREAAGIAGAVVLLAAVVLGGVAAMALVFRLPLVRLFTQ